MPREEETNVDDSAATHCSLRCPKCGSAKIAGLMAAFWVSLASDETMEGQWSDYESATEIGDERLCSECSHEF